MLQSASQQTQIPVGHFELLLYSFSCLIGLSQGLRKERRHSVVLGPHGLEIRDSLGELLAFCLHLARCLLGRRRCQPRLGRVASCLGERRLKLPRLLAGSSRRSIGATLLLLLAVAKCPLQIERLLELRHEIAQGRALETHIVGPTGLDRLEGRRIGELSLHYFVGQGVLSGSLGGLTRSLLRISQRLTSSTVILGGPFDNGRYLL